MRFARSMLDQSKTWAAGGHVPAWLPFRDSDAYRRMTPQSAYADSADVAVYDPDGWYSGSGSDFETVMGSSIGAAMAGQLSPQAAIEAMRSKLTTLAQSNPPVDFTAGGAA
jgi:multiple sugar transport system substrate-binding protein